MLPSIQGTDTSLGISIFIVLLSCIAAQNGTDTWDMSGTTLEPETTTEDDDDIEFAKLLALIVLSAVLAFLMLAVFACGCYVCMKMKDKQKNRDGQDLVYEGHYSSKKINGGNRTRVVAVKTDMYKKKQEPFWGVQHAVADSLDRPYGYDNAAFRNNQPYGGQSAQGYSPLGAGSNQRFYR